MSRLQTSELPSSRTPGGTTTGRSRGRLRCHDQDPNCRQYRRDYGRSASTASVMGGSSVMGKSSLLVAARSISLFPHLVHLQTSYSILVGSSENPSIPRPPVHSKSVIFPHFSHRFFFTFMTCASLAININHNYIQVLSTICVLGTDLLGGHPGRHPRWDCGHPCPNPKQVDCHHPERQQALPPGGPGRLRCHDQDPNCRQYRSIRTNNHSHIIIE